MIDLEEVARQEAAAIGLVLPDVIKIGVTRFPARGKGPSNKSAVVTRTANEIKVYDHVTGAGFLVSTDKNHFLKG